MTTDAPRPSAGTTARADPDGRSWAGAAMLRVLICGVAGLGGGARAEPDAAPADRQAVARGQTLLARYHCGTCHTIPGVAAARSTTAANLGAYGRRTYLAGRWPNQPELLARWIVDPAAMAPGSLMPAMGVSVADARDMAAYLLALRE